MALAPQTTVESTEFYLVIFRGNKIVAGEGWRETQPQSTIERQTKLAMQEGDQAILVVDEVKTNTRTYRLEKEDVTKNILALIRNEAFNELPVQISMKQLNIPSLVRVQGGGYCTTALGAATGACESQGGISSFSCSDKDQNFSFTCRGNKPLQPPPGTN